jgi:hypothetical protein
MSNSIKVNNVEYRIYWSTVKDKHNMTNNEILERDFLFSSIKREAEGLKKQLHLKRISDTECLYLIEA